MTRARTPRTAALLAAFLTAHTLGPDASAQADLSHRQTGLTVRVVDRGGVAAADAILDLDLRQHQFRFGTQIQSADYLGNAAFRDIADTYFNSITPTIGFNWRYAEGDVEGQASDFIAAAAQAKGAGLDVRGHAVLWPQNRWWLNPLDVLPETAYLTGENDPAEWIWEGGNPDAATLKARVDGRIADAMAWTTAAGNPYGVTVTEFDGTNETIDRNAFEAQDILTPKLIEAGYYADKADAIADWYRQMDAARPDARFVMNEYGVMTADTDAEAHALRDYVQAVLDAGGPVDAIGLQMHLWREVDFETMNRRVDILAETGLQVEFTEFDHYNGLWYDDAAQGRTLEAALRTAFENPNVSGFTMWGFEDTEHWFGDGVLFDGELNRKASAASFFDLVHGEWWTDLAGAQDRAEAALTRGTYDVRLNGDPLDILEGFELNTLEGVLVVAADGSDGWLLGDLTGDLTVDAADADAMLIALQDLAAFDAAYGGLNPLERGDLDGDGSLGLSDYRMLDGWLDTVALRHPGTPIPEPTTAAFAAVLAGMLLSRRRTELWC